MWEVLSVANLVLFYLEYCMKSPHFSTVQYKVICAKLTSMCKLLPVFSQLDNYDILILMVFAQHCVI